MTSVGLNAGSGNVIATGYFGRDANDYIAWSNDSHAVIFVGGTERLRVNTSGIDVSGSIVADADITAYSDERLKSNVELIPDALAKINELDGFTYDMEDREGNVLGRKTGVIAQHVQKVLPEAVMEDEDGYLSVAYGNMVGLLIQGMNEMTKNLGDAHKTLGMQSDVIAQQGEQIKKMQAQIDAILERE